MLIESVRTTARRIILSPTEYKVELVTPSVLWEYRTMYKQLHVRTYREFVVRNKDQLLTSMEDTESVENQW